jgi:hypothetical protein
LAAVVQAQQRVLTQMEQVVLILFLVPLHQLVAAAVALV